MKKASKSPEPLKLQSYKIDTTSLQSKIYQLDQIKSDLQSSLARQRQQQDHRIQQILILKTENQKLKSTCQKHENNVKTQTMLIQQLENKLIKSQENFYRYQEELKKKEEELKLLEENHKSQIELLNRQIQSLTLRLHEKSLKTSNVVQVNSSKEFNDIMNKLSDQSIADSDHSSSHGSRKIKRLKSSPKQPEETIVQQQPTSPVTKQKYLMVNQISEKEEESNLSAEDIYLEMIRLLYKQLIKIELKARDISKIPIIDSFAQVLRPTKNDIAKLLSSYPFQIKQAHKAEIIYNFIHDELQRKGHHFSGSQIIYEIRLAVEEIEADKQYSLQEGGISSMMNDSDLSIGQLLKPGLSKKSLEELNQYEKDAKERSGAYQYQGRYL